MLAPPLKAIKPEKNGPVLYKCTENINNCRWLGMARMKRIAT